MAQKDVLTTMARHIKHLTHLVSRMAERLNALEAKNEWGDRAAQEDTSCPFVFYPVRVTAVSTATKDFTGRVQMPGTTSATPWIDDTDYPVSLNVSVATTACLPTVGDIVRADFTGTYTNSFLPRYGWFGTLSTTITNVATTIVYCPVVTTGTGTLSFITSIAIASGALVIYQGSCTISATVTSAVSTVSTIGTTYTSVISLRVSSLDLQAVSQSAVVLGVNTPTSWWTWHTGTQCTS